MPFGEAVISDDASEARKITFSEIRINQPLSKFLSRPLPNAKLCAFLVQRHSKGWIPFELYDGFRMFIPATVNGQHVSVLLDTGAVFIRVFGLFPYRSRRDQQFLRSLILATDLHL
jgi:hypothetical protein